MPRRRAKLITALCAAVLCVALCALPALADADLTRAGSVSVSLRCADAPVAGAGFTVYRVADVSVSGDGLDFELTAEFSGSGLDLGDTGSGTLAEGLVSWIDLNGLPGAASGKTDENGLVSFAGLGCGLYLVRQTGEAEGFYPVSAFLVSIPMTRDGEWVYDVEASPKAEAGAPTATAAPTAPPGETLVQTGQLNWPVPVLAGVGVVLFAVGWALYFLGRKNGDA